MKLVDEKFKDCDPKQTVKQIQEILDRLGIQVEETWNESGIDGCYSVKLSALEGIPTYNGKGVSKDFARASAYAEFMERLQSGLFTVRYQSLYRNPKMNLHNYAPDGKTVTVEELIRDGEWMDYIIKAYKNPQITRQSIAEHCQAYACSDDGKILTLPFYSLFEDKYVYLPAAFVARVYTGNGNCAGNSRAEAWVHALSEIMERHMSQKMVRTGVSIPELPKEVLNQFPTVRKILEQLHSQGDFDVAVFDCSFGMNFPVVCTRIIDKKNQCYLVNYGADPILEIAIQRTLTELFQGRGVQNLSGYHSNKILNRVDDFPVVHNVLNQTQISEGLYTADFFANEISCRREATVFADNSEKSNQQLLQDMLNMYKSIGHPVYVRNYSYLGFHSYKIVVPGFSETGAGNLDDLIPEYAIADGVSAIYRNLMDATDEDMQWILQYAGICKSLYSRYNNFAMNAGVPLVGAESARLMNLTRAYACYRIGNYTEAIANMKQCINNMDANDEFRMYFACVNKYLEMKKDGIDEEKIRCILYKFFVKKYPDALYEKLDNGKTPYDDYLLKCDFKSCDMCKHKNDCRYEYLEQLTEKVGRYYSQFDKGQDRSEFLLD